jgi:hypothetical protein
MGAAGKLLRAWAAGLPLLAACARPPMEVLTEATLAAAEHRWAAHGAASYHLVVRIRPPRFAAAVYDVVVDRGRVTAIERDSGEVIPAGDTRDYSVPGLFHLLREDLRLADVPRVGDVPPIDLRAQFEPETGRLVRYRRTVGTASRRVLLVEVLAYEPAP